MDQYRKNAMVADPLVQSGRGKEFSVVGFLHVVREIMGLLELRCEHQLLDVGCANGLMEIVLSACCRHVVAIEPVEELASTARKNLGGCPNVRVEVGHGASLLASDGTFDRVLMLEVIQLMTPEETQKVFRELQRVTRRGGRIVVGSVPDARHREDFLSRYLAGVRKADHLSEEQKMAIIARNRKATWYDPVELMEWWKELGGQATVRHPSPAYPNADHRFHLIVEVEK